MTPPTPAQVRADRKAAGHTQAKAAELVHASRRTWMSWESDGPEGRGMSPADRELYLLKTGQHPDWVLVARPARR